jgi:hypothetical protein
VQVEARVVIIASINVFDDDYNALGDGTAYNDPDQRNKDFCKIQ